MNAHYTYLIILMASLAAPLSLSFDKKVAFYKQWKFLFPAMVIPATFYIIWDVLFTSKNVWSFNDNYITGIYIFNLPIEEVLFFFVVPYCCVFIYECIRCYFTIRDNKTSRIIFYVLAAILMILGILFFDRDYTGFTFVLTSVGIIIVYLLSQLIEFNARLVLTSYAIVMVPFLIVNGFLTAIPVIRYNNAENLGIRIFTIPVEDIFYGFLLFLMNIIIFEILRKRSSVKL